MVPVGKQGEHRSHFGGPTLNTDPHVSDRLPRKKELRCIAFFVNLDDERLEESCTFLGNGLET